MGSKAVLSAASMVCIAVCAACSSEGNAKTDVRVPQYSTSDTAHYGTLPDTGSSVVLKRDGVVVDTVDARFGAQIIGPDSVLYQSHSSTHYMLFDGKTAKPIAAMLPGFDEKLSAPSTVDNAILYWAIHSTNGVDSVRATRYEFARARLNQLPVPAKVDRTRGRYWFTPPFLDGKEIVFKAPDGEWRFRTPKQN